MKPRWKRLYEGAYSLKDRGPAGPVSMFLLVGTEKALLIDSGYGLLDLSALIREITDKPVILVNTHGHLPESLSVGEYRSVLERMQNELQQRGILWNYAAHNPRKARIQDDIRRFLLCCDAILTGSKKPRFMDAGVTSGNFVGKAGRYILYSKE